jgi:hypothetical protein
MCGKPGSPGCFEGDKTMTAVGLPSSQNTELLFELDDVMAGIATECKKNLPISTTKQKVVF